MGRIENIKATFEIDLFKNFHMEIILDKNAEDLKEYDEKHTICRVKIHDESNDDFYERELFFPLDTKVSCINDLFKNEIALIAKSWKKGCYFDWITDSNPQTAWIFYKKTFDKVMAGKEIWESSSLDAEIEWVQADGNKTIYRHLPDGSERVFCGEKYIGRIETKMTDEAPYVEWDVPFILDLNTQSKYPGVEYEDFFASKGLYIEPGCRIFHGGNINGILDGIEEMINEKR